MGQTCSRLDCAGAQNAFGHSGDSPRQAPYNIWYDCAGAGSVRNSLGQGCTQPSTASSGLQKEANGKESEVKLHSANFRSSWIHGQGASAESHWKHRYILGRELGTGQTAAVYEAYAVVPEERNNEASKSHADCATGCEIPSRACQVAIDSLGFPRNDRRVALKRFHRSGSSMFRQEVKVMRHIGVHPNILRLLESFEGGPEHDALILEYCEEGDLYELYAKGHGRGMPESFVIRLIRQALKALHHLVACGVEHRDVKPENLLLFGSTAHGHRLKLCDFGWSTMIVPGRPAKVPEEGVGSLWYAPPELNPPVPGMKHINITADTPPGSSDMWSIGVVTYLLLVGHSPFNTALRAPEDNVEGEVLRLVAEGTFNVNSKAWKPLSSQAKSFVSDLLQPDPNARMSVADAVNHAFIVQLEEDYDDIGMPQMPMWQSNGHLWHIWDRLDGLQRLSWLSVAYAVSEVELEGGLQDQALKVAAPGRFGYGERLAAELAGLALPKWFQPRSNWSAVLRLGFRYLDCDGDGELSVEDLSKHLEILPDLAVGSNQGNPDVARLWLARWRSARPAGGFDFDDFRSCLRSHSLDGADTVEYATAEELINWPGDLSQAASEQRLREIEEGMMRFMVEEGEPLHEYTGAPGSSSDKYERH